MINTATNQPFVIENLEFLKPILEQLFNPVVISTLHLMHDEPHIVYANRAFCKQTGYALPELLGQSPQIFLGEETYRNTFSTLKQTFQIGEIFLNNTVNYKKDGSQYFAEWNISSLSNQEGEMTHYFCVQNDISVSKELENSTQLLQEYKDTVDESAIVSKTNPNGIITYVNSQFCKISGYSAHELVGKNHNIVHHPDMQKEFFSDIWYTIKEQKETWHGKIKNRKKDGTHYWVEATIKPILNTSGEIVEYIALRHDITELENYEESLKKKLDETTQWLSEYEDAIVGYNTLAKTTPELIITDVNDNYSNLTKYTKEEMIGRSITEFVDEASLHNLDEIIETIQSGEPYKNIFKGKPKYGEIFYTEGFLKPIKNKNGEIIEHFIIGNDVTQLINFHKEIEETQKEIVYKMGEIGESRSKETGYHVRRVAEYSKLLALLAGLSHEEADILFIASPMHDIGKVAIPDNILNKPGKLTEEEFNVMKSHAQIGYEVLKGSSRSVLQSAAIVAYQHHERWDGHGYPQGLKGEKIHIYGRITAIADVFDALGHDRVYKKAWEIDAILELFKKESGNQFDPTLINLFFENLNLFLEIQNRFRDSH